MRFDPNCAGFHIGPLMASIGGVGVVVGLATQDLLQNLTAAVSLVRCACCGCCAACCAPHLPEMFGCCAARAALRAQDAVVLLTQASECGCVTCCLAQYVTRPFVAGDHVKLINQEGVEVEVRGSTSTPLAATAAGGGRVGVRGGSAQWLCGAVPLPQLASTGQICCR